MIDYHHSRQEPPATTVQPQHLPNGNIHTSATTQNQSETTPTISSHSHQHQSSSSSIEYYNIKSPTTTTTDSMMHSFENMAGMKRGERHHLPPTYDDQRGKKVDGERVVVNDNIASLQENNVKRQNVTSYSYYLNGTSSNGNFVAFHQQQNNSSSDTPSCFDSSKLTQQSRSHNMSSSNSITKNDSGKMVVVNDVKSHNGVNEIASQRRLIPPFNNHRDSSNAQTQDHKTLTRSPNNSNTVIINYPEKVSCDTSTKDQHYVQQPIFQKGNSYFHHPSTQIDHNHFSIRDDVVYNDGQYQSSSTMQQLTNSSYQDKRISESQPGISCHTQRYPFTQHPQESSQQHTNVITYPGNRQDKWSNYYAYRDHIVPYRDVNSSNRRPSVDENNKPYSSPNSIYPNTEERHYQPKENLCSTDDRLFCVEQHPRLNSVSNDDQIHSNQISGMKERQSSNVMTSNTFNYHTQDQHSISSEIYDDRFSPHLTYNNTTNIEEYANSKSGMYTLYNNSQNNGGSDACDTTTTTAYVHQDETPSYQGADKEQSPINHGSMSNEATTLHSTPYYIDTTSSSYLHPQITTTNELTQCNNYSNRIERIATNHPYSHESSPDHLPPTPYSYDPSTPCPAQQIQQQQPHIKPCLENSQILADNQNAGLPEATSVRSPDHFPPTPYSSDPPTPYAHSGTNIAQHCALYGSPEHEGLSDGNAASGTGLEFDHLPPTPYSLDLCSPNSEHSSELISNPTRSLINRFSHPNDQNNPSFFSSTYSGEVKSRLTQRDEIISNNFNDKHLISQKSHKEIKDLSLPTLHKTTDTLGNGQNKDLITNDPSLNSDLLDTNTDKMTKSHHQLNEDLLSDPFKESPEAFVKNDSQIYSDTRTFVDKVPHRFGSNIKGNFNEDISASQNTLDSLGKKNETEMYNNNNTHLQQNLSLLQFGNKGISSLTKEPNKRRYSQSVVNKYKRKSPGVKKESPYSIKATNEEVSAPSSSLSLYRQLAKVTTSSHSKAHHTPCRFESSSKTDDIILPHMSTVKDECMSAHFIERTPTQTPKRAFKCEWEPSKKRIRAVNTKKESQEIGNKSKIKHNLRENISYNPEVLDAVFDEVINDFNTFLPHGKDITVGKEFLFAEKKDNDAPTNKISNSKMVHLEFSLLKDSRSCKTTSSNNIINDLKKKRSNICLYESAKNVNVSTVIAHTQQDMGDDSSGVNDTFLKLQSKQALFCGKKPDETKSKDTENIITTLSVISANNKNAELRGEDKKVKLVCLSASTTEIKTKFSSNVSLAINKETPMQGGLDDDTIHTLPRAGNTQKKMIPLLKFPSSKITTKCNSHQIVLPFKLLQENETNNFRENEKLLPRMKILERPYHQSILKSENGAKDSKTISYSNLDSSCVQIDKEFEKQVLRGQININSRQEHEQDKLHQHQIHKETQIAKRKRKSFVMYKDDYKEKSGCTRIEEGKPTNLQNCSETKLNNLSLIQGTHIQTENKLLEFSGVLSSKDNDEETRLRSRKRRKISGHTLNNGNNLKLVEDKDLDHKDEEKEKELPTKRLETITLPLSLESSEKDLKPRSDLLKFFGTNGKIKRIMREGEEEKYQFPSPKNDNNLEYKPEKKLNNTTDDVTYGDKQIVDKDHPQRKLSTIISNSIVKKSNNDDADTTNGPTSRQFTFKCSKCPAEFPLQNVTDICEHVLTESSKRQPKFGMHNSKKGGVRGGIGSYSGFSAMFKYFTYRVKLFVTPAICQVQAHCVIVCLCCRREFGTNLSSTSSDSSSKLLSSSCSKAENDCNHLAKTLFQHLVICHKFEADVKNKNFCIFCDKRAVNFNQHLIDYEKKHNSRINALSIFGCETLNNSKNVVDKSKCVTTTICQSCDKTFKLDIRLPDWLSRFLCSLCISKLVFSVNENDNGDIKSPGMTKMSDKWDKSRKNTLVVLCSFCRQGKYGHHILLPLRDNTAYINEEEFVQNVKLRKNDGRNISNSTESRQRPTSICVNCLEIYDTFTKKILMLSSIDAKENIYTSDKDKNNSKSEEGEIINGIPSKISAKECENYFEKMLNDLIIDLDGNVVKSDIETNPPAISQCKKIIVSPNVTTAKFNRLPKKVAIVTPEQRTKNFSPCLINPVQCKNIKKNDVIPTFSCKQLLSSIIRRRASLDNGSFQLNEHQIFSIDCKKAIQVLSENKKGLNNNNEIDNNDEFTNRKSYNYKCLGCDASWLISNDNISSIVSHFSPKWSYNSLEETFSPKKHIGKMFDQRQSILKWSYTPKDSSTKALVNITLLTILQCRKCKLYFPGPHEKVCENTAYMHLLLEHSNKCHKKIVEEWKHHQSLSIKSLSCPLCGKRDIHGDHEMGGQDCQRSLANSLLIGCHSRSSEFLTCKICRCSIHQSIINCENSLNYLRTSTCIICYECLTSCFLLFPSSSSAKKNETMNIHAQENVENSPSRCVTCKTRKSDSETNHIVSFQKKQINYQVNFCHDCWQILSTQFTNMKSKNTHSPMKEKSVVIFKRLIKDFMRGESIEELLAAAKNGLF